MPPGCRGAMDQHVEDLAFVVDGTPQVHPLAGHSPGMGRLWLGLASRPRSLEPVERRVGSATLRAKPFRPVAWCLRRNRATPPGVGATTGRLARSPWRLGLLRRRLGQ